MEDDLSVQQQRVPGDIARQIAARIHRHTAVLIRVPRRRTAVEEGFPIGSGTLVTIGKHRGILPAAHVAAELEAGDQLGLTIAPEGEIHSPRVPFPHLRIVSLGSSPWSEYGPDNSFIRLPDEKAWAHEAWKGFYDLLEVRDQMLPRPRPDPNETAWTPAICGSPEEFVSEEGPAAGHSRILSFRQMCWMVRKPKHSTRSGHDYLDLEMNREEDPDLFPNLAGVSGGGMWYITFAENHTSLHPERFLLTGVAFYQIRSGDQRSTLRFHGWTTIYQRAIDEVLRTLP